MVGKSQNVEFTCVEEKENSFALDNKKREELEELQRLGELKKFLESDDTEKLNKKKKKKMYLKDVQAQQLLEKGPDYIEEDEKRTYAELQEESRRALTDAFEAGSDEDGDDLFLRVAAEKEENDEELDKKYDEFIEHPVLKDYLKNQRWKEKDVKSSVIDEAVLLEELEEDEEALEMQEDYETNLVMGQSRKVEGSVRKVNKARKAQRKSKEERMELDKIERKEELKRLKNTKKKEIKEKRKRKTSKEEAEMEEYYKLDYEDTIGDLKTRFKYAKVEPNKYELETEEILRLDDTELNQYVPLKKMAPYVEKDWEVNKYKVKEQKRKKKSEIKPTQKPKVEEDEVAESKLSKKAKRRRHQAEKKLSLNRMAAYGKVVKP